MDRTSPDRVVAGLVGDRYEITGLIATGGMGTVYRARDHVLDRTVALKVLKAGEDPSFAARFRTEATNAARLSHANVVRVYDFGYSDDTPYMAMEFVDGQTLRDVLNDRGRLEPPAAARIAQQIASALEHARRGGIVHRDVKPENVLITTDGDVKVADFGLSRALAESRATQAGVLFGTAHYLAPEQIAGGEVDHRTDVYALGVVLFEMLTGRPPFEGDTTVVIAYKRVNEDVPSLQAVDASLPRELDTIVARATARDPVERYPTAGEMADALRRAAPRWDTGEIGGLVHHTEAIPVGTQETIQIAKQGATPAMPSRAATSKTRRFKRWIALAVALFVVGASVYTGVTKLQRTEVPTLVGLSQTDAIGALKAAGFDATIVQRKHPTVPDQHVIEQSPAAGVLFRDGSAVELTVSLGPEVVGVPEVTGMAFADAESLLASKGFTVRRVDAFHAEAKALTVTGQEPESGLLIAKGSPVTLTVSKGPEMVRVPDVGGDASSTATLDLEAAGFTVKIIEKNHASVASGDVISQSPKAGSQAARGSSVTITVSKGPVMVTVPRIICMTKAQAADVLAAKGFKISYSGSQKMVVDQSPESGKKAPRGSTITAFMGPGSFC